MPRTPVLIISLSTALCLSSLGQTASQSRPKQQKSGPNFFTVAPVPPPYCDLNLIAIGSIDGSDAYRRLRAISEALTTAQDAAENLKQASETLKGEDSPEHLFSNLFEAEQKTIDGLHCAAQVMNAYKQKPENRKDDLVTVTLIVGFNQEAYAIELVRASQKERFSRSSKPSPAQSISDGEKLQRATDVQRDAGSSILTASELAASISADMQDKAKQIEYSQLSCKENDQIVHTLKATSEKTETIYGQSSKAILEFLDPLKCKI